MLLQYAMEQGWELYNIYSDDDYTGSDQTDARNLTVCSQTQKRDKFDIILCKTQSRFTRELELVEKYIHGLFPIWGIRFISIVDNADTANKGNKKSRQINGLVNEWYLGGYVGEYPQRSDQQTSRTVFTSAHLPFTGTRKTRTKRGI